MSLPLRRVAVFNDTRRTSHYGCEIVMERLIAQLRQRAIEPVFFWPMGVDWRGQSGVDAVLRSVDGVVVNGEGSIHHSDRRPRAHYLAEIAAHARQVAGIPSFLINTSLHAIDQAVIDKLAAYQGIYLRESRSMAVLEGSGLAAERVPDLTLGIAAPHVEFRQGVLCTDSVNAALADRLRRLARRRGWHHCRLTHAARPRLAEYGPGREYLRRHGKWLHALLTGRNTRHRRHFVPFLGGHALLCTGRFHAVTLALATATPFVAVESNTPKISGLLEDVFGSPRRVLTLDDIEQVADAQDYDWLPSERNALAMFLQSADASMHRMFDRIRKHLDECA